MQNNQARTKKPGGAKQDTSNDKLQNGGRDAAAHLDAQPFTIKTLSISATMLKARHGSWETH
ncbi:hypothetical protein [Methyloceanibacter stevinii]|uniref:hypothetical protein n=1 Tax=Methyloceanibacter stevinii TaxID=1774970 RepID=UPI001300EE31|nr:hypothetical protein [Methyloceanibacter stevinii]